MNCLEILVVIRVNYLKAVNEYLNYIEAMRYNVRIARISIQFD
jgi:hypothetical protein